MEFLVRQVRKSLGISREQLAEISGISLWTLGTKERGLREFKTSELEQCAHALTYLSGHYVPIEALYKVSPLRPLLICQCGAVVVSCATPACPTHQAPPRQVEACGVCTATGRQPGAEEARA